MICQKYVDRFGSTAYFLFRVLIGLLFVQHGAQKLFGAFGGINGQAAALVSLMGLAGLIEFIGGLAIATGFFTRLVAGIAGIEMIVAFFMVHAPQGWMPLTNQGELALLYLAGFLALSVYGSGRWSLEAALLKKEHF